MCAWKASWSETIAVPGSEEAAAIILARAHNANQSMVNVLRESAISSKRKITRLSRAYFRSDLARIAAYNRAVTRRESAERAAAKAAGEPAPCRMTALQRVARGLNLNAFRQSQRRARIKNVPKSSGRGLRDIWLFDDEAKALQLMVAQCLKPSKQWDQDQYLFEGGVPACCWKLVAALKQTTRAFVYKADISNCYGSFDPEVVARALPIPEVVTRNVVLCEGYIPYGDVPVSLLRHRGGGFSGIPGGSACSPMVAEIILAPLIEYVRHALVELGISGEIFVYADDFVVATDTREDAYAIERVLRDGLATVSAGSLRLGTSEVRSVDEGFRFLGVWFERNAYGGVEATHLKPHLDERLSEIEVDLAGIWETGARGRLPINIDHRLQSIELVHGYSRSVMRRIEAMTDPFVI